MVSLNSNDWEEYWNTKIIPRNGLTSKKIKLEQCNDKVLSLPGHCKVYLFNDCVFILRILIASYS